MKKAKQRIPSEFALEPHHNSLLQPDSQSQTSE
jgi:hypothetical protein